MDQNCPLHSHWKKAYKPCNWLKILVEILLVIGTWEKRFDGSYSNNKVTNTYFDSQGFIDLSGNSSMRSFCHIRHSLVTELDQSRWLNESYVFLCSFGPRKMTLCLFTCKRGKCISELNWNILWSILDLIIFLRDVT